MFSNISVIIAEDLSRKIYSFYVEDFNKIWLDWYAYESRESKRHKFVRVQYYNRLEKRNSNLLEEDVILTDDIKNAIEQKIFSSLQIKKWSERE